MEKFQQYAMRIVQVDVVKVKSTFGREKAFLLLILLITTI